MPRTGKSPAKRAAPPATAEEPFELNGHPLLEVEIVDASLRPLRVPYPQLLLFRGDRPVFGFETRLAEFRDTAPPGALAAYALLVAGVAFVDEIAARWPTTDASGHHQARNLISLAAALRQIVARLRCDREAERIAASMGTGAANRAFCDLDPLAMVGLREGVESRSGAVHASLHHAARAVIVDTFAALLFALAHAGLLSETEPWRDAAARVGSERVGADRMRDLWRVWQRMQAGERLEHGNVGAPFARVWSGSPARATVHPGKGWPSWATLPALLRAEIGRAAVAGTREWHPPELGAAILLVLSRSNGLTGWPAVLDALEPHGYVNGDSVRAKGAALLRAGLVEWTTVGRRCLTVTDEGLERLRMLRSPARSP